MRSGEFCGNERAGQIYKKKFKGENMASSTVHLAITEELIRRRKFSNPERLRFGAVLPDFRKSGNSHLFIFPCGGYKKAYDMAGFLARVGERMREDDLYLGYYLHLVQDIGYRHYVYDRYKWNPMLEGNVERLHRDYALVNPHIVARYGLQNNIVVPEGFAAEPLTELAEFDTDGLLRSMQEYLTQQPEGDIFFFTREMSDEFIEESVEECLKELDRIERGEPLADGYDNAWERTANPKSMLESTSNTRDLAMFRIEGTDEYTKSGRIVRSDMPKELSENALASLRKNDITTVIDLRGSWEVEHMPHGLKDAEGFSYHNMPIEAGSWVPESVEAVPGSYMTIAESEAMAEALRLIATTEHGVWFNCSAGKDRTGVLTAILLRLCGVSKSDIVFDYLITKKCNYERLMQFHEKFPDIDINIVIPCEAFMEGFFELMSAKYGTVQNYCESMGIGEELQRAIVRKMTA